MANNLILIDTNLYLDDANIIYKLHNNINTILIPKTILRELDNKKYNKDLSYSARNAIRTILEFSASKESFTMFDTEKYAGENIDDQIINCAKKHNAKVATKDICMSVTAKSLGLETTLYDTVLNNVYDPYVYVHMNSLVDADYIFEYHSEYKNTEYKTVVDFLSVVANRVLDRDMWWFVFINNDSKNDIVYANNPLTNTLVRIDDKAKYRELKTEGSTVKAKDNYQVCAIYALEEAPHVLLTGRYGSGKTLLATAHTLATSRKKAFITRAPIGINSKYDIGYLPGSKEDKLVNWLQGFMSALYYLYSNTRADDDYNDNVYDYVKDRVFNETFEIMSMNSIQGLSLLKEDVLIVDECQLIDISYMSMVLSRPSEGSKLILLGDSRQAYDTVRPAESGLLKLLRVLPNKHLAYVELQNSYRSPILEVADKLQDKSIL